MQTIQCCEVFAHAPALLGLEARQGDQQVADDQDSQPHQWSDQRLWRLSKGTYADLLEIRAGERLPMTLALPDRDATGVKTRRELDWRAW